jgi:hypothetical protein
MSREAAHRTRALERLDRLLVRVFSEVVRRAVGEKRFSDQYPAPPREAGDASVARDQGAMLWVGRLAAAGAAWVRALRALPREEQRAVVDELEMLLNDVRGVDAEPAS